MLLKRKASHFSCARKDVQSKANESERKCYMLTLYNFSTFKHAAVKSLNTIVLLIK